MKYIILLDKEHNQKYPFIFAANLTHSVAANHFKHLLARENITRDVEVFSAGFIYLKDISCHGESETLNVKHHESDTLMIENYSYFHGLV